MSKFDSLSGEKEYLHMNSKRSAALVELSKLKKALEALPKDNPSLRSFEHIESKVEVIVSCHEIIFSESSCTQDINKQGPQGFRSNS